MDHLVKVTKAKLRKSKREAYSLQTDVELITIDDDEESVNEEEVSSNKTPNEKLAEENNNESDVEGELFKRSLLELLKCSFLIQTFYL